MPISLARRHLGWLPPLMNAAHRVGPPGRSEDPPGAAIAAFSPRGGCRRLLRVVEEPADVARWRGRRTPRCRSTRTACEAPWGHRLARGPAAVRAGSRWPNIVSMHRLDRSLSVVEANGLAEPTDRRLGTGKAAGHDETKARPVRS